MKALLAFTILLLSTVFAPAALAQDLDGQITGVVVDPTGVPLAGQRVELRKPDRHGQLVTTSDAEGAFTFRNVRPGRYEVELIIEGRTVGKSGPVELSERTMRVTGIVVTQRPRWARSDRHVARLPRTTVRQLLGTQDVATSFDALQAIVKPGQQVGYALFGSRNDASRGKATVAELTADHVVLLRRRLFRTQEIVLPEDVVHRIDIMDPTTKGVLIGAGIGGALGLALILGTLDYASKQDCNLCPLNYGFGILLPILGGGIGGQIDGLMNEAIYERRAQAPRVTFAPLLGRGRIGVMARVGF